MLTFPSTHHHAQHPPQGLSEPLSMISRIFRLFSHSTDINGIRPFGDPSSPSFYSCSQPLSVKVCNSRSYSSRKCLGAGYSARLFLNEASGLSPGHFQDTTQILLILSVKVGLVDGNGCAQGSIRWRKAHSPITSHAYTSQILDGVKSELQVKPK